MKLFNIVGILFFVSLVTFLCKGHEHTHAPGADVDLIIFSYRRPLQLYAYLESIAAHVHGLRSVVVLYRINEPEYEPAYAIVRAAFPDVVFVKEDNKQPQDIKPLMIQLVSNASSGYIMFGVDDMVVLRDVDLCHCTTLLSQTGAYGFYLRLGAHVDYCYILDQQQGVPPFSHPYPGICEWQFSKGELDWSYMHTTDMTIFRKVDLVPVVVALPYKSPHQFEDYWMCLKNLVIKRTGLCFEKAVAVALPINIVKDDWKLNKMTGNYTYAQLLDLFNQGLKIEIEPLCHIINRSAHMDYEPTFVMRDTRIYYLCTEIDNVNNPLLLSW